MGTLLAGRFRAALDVIGKAGALAADVRATATRTRFGGDADTLDIVFTGAWSVLMRGSGDRGDGGQEKRRKERGAHDGNQG